MLAAPYTQASEDVRTLAETLLVKYSVLKDHNSNSFELNEMLKAA